MASFTYKLTTKKNMKATGILDLSHMTIEIDGESKIHTYSSIWLRSSCNYFKRRDKGRRRAG